MQLTKKNKGILVLFILFFQISIGQTLPSKNITVNDGLPSNTIRCIFKDSKGLLWIGTDSGLCCYDGKSYRVFNETNGLNPSMIWAIAEDGYQNLWLSTYGSGFVKFDGQKFTYFNTKDGLCHRAVRKMHYSKAYHCLILGTENGLSIFDGTRFKSFNPYKGKGFFQVVGIHETKGGILIFTSNGASYLLKIKNKIEFSVLEKSFELPGMTYSSYVDQGKFLFGNGSKQLIIRDFKTNAEKIIAAPIIWDFAKGETDRVYCAGWNVNEPTGGLYRYSNHQLSDITQQARIQSISIWCLYYDKETKQLWVGTLDKGLYRIDLSNEIAFFKPEHFGVKELQIQELFTDKQNQLWVGAKDYIIVIKSNLQYLKFDFSSLKSKIETYLKKLKVTGLPADVLQFLKNTNGFTCFNITSDNEGNTWVNTTFGTLCFDMNYKIKYFYYSNGGHLIFDNKDQALFSGMYIETQIIPNKFRWDQSIHLSQSEKTTPLDVVKVLKTKNDVWIGSQFKGLFYYQNNQFYPLNYHGLFKENCIKDFAVSPSDELIIGTNSGSVYFAKWNKKRFSITKKYLPNKHLLGSTVSFIVPFKDSYFIGTNSGINVIQNDRFSKILNQFEGIHDVQFNDATADKKDNIWIGTNEGLICLNPQNILDSSMAIPKTITISSLKLNDKEYLTNPLFSKRFTNKNSVLKLEYNQNNIEIQYGVNNLYNASKDVFRYKLEGLMRQWSKYESDNTFQLREIPPGHYTLWIEGKNIGTDAIYPAKKIDITIAPPFWKTIGFIAVSALLLLGLGYWGYLKRVGFIKKEEKAKGMIQKRLAETKMEALQSQMNPHFIFNAMNSVQNYIIDHNIDEALHYMGAFSKLIRQTLNHSSKSSISLSDEIIYLNTYITLENNRFNEKITVKIVVDEAVDADAIEIPPMLIQPFVENVFVHAFDHQSVNPTLTIHFSVKESNLVVAVKDNGKGMWDCPLKKLHHSKGIELAKERLALFDGYTNDPITILSESGNGTTIQINIAL